MDYRKCRYAFWKHYEGYCFYCQNLITSFNDATIDHIIPKNNFESDGITLKLNRSYELQNDFSKDHFSNLVLSCVGCNRNLKGAEAFSEKSELFFIEIARKSSEKILQIHEKFLVDRSQLRQDALRDQPLESFLEPKKFEEANKLYLDAYHCFFIRSTEKVYVQCNLPSLASIQGNCIVDFYNGKTMWSLTHEQIKQLLNFNSSEELRRFLTRGIDNEKRIFVTFGTIAEFYLEDIFEDIIHVLFDLATVYKKQYDAVLTEMEIIEEDFSDVTQLQYLGTIDRNLWKDMVETAYQTQQGEGISRWHVFAPTDSFLTIMSEDGHAIAARVFPGKKDEPLWESYKWMDSDVDIFWKFLESKNHIQKDADIWTAKQTKEFIDNYIKYVKTTKKVTNKWNNQFYFTLKKIIKKL